MKNEEKKWAKGKYSFTSVELMRRLLHWINAKISNHRNNSTVLCFQHFLLEIEASYEAIQTFYWLYIHALLLVDVMLDENSFTSWS